MNQVERWFGLPTDKLIRRGVHASVKALEDDIRAWIDTWNENPRPFTGPRPPTKSSTPSPTTSPGSEPPARKQSRTNPQDFWRITLAGEQVAAAPYGIAVAKNSTQVHDALKAALDAIIKNGDYGKIISKLGVPNGAVTEARINDGHQ